MCSLLRDAGTGGGGGAVRATPPNLEAVGAPPTQLWTGNAYVIFYFCLFLHVSMGPSPKKYWAKFAEFLVLGRKDLGRHFKVIPASLSAP